MPGFSSLLQTMLIVIIINIIRLRLMLGYLHLIPVHGWLYKVSDSWIFNCVMLGLSGYQLNVELLQQSWQWQTWYSRQAGINIYKCLLISFYELKTSGILALCADPTLQVASQRLCKINTYFGLLNAKRNNTGLILKRITEQMSLFRNHAK